MDVAVCARGHMLGFLRQQLIQLTTVGSCQVLWLQSREAADGHDAVAEQILVSCLAPLARVCSD